MTIITKPRTETKTLVKHEVEGGECVVVDPKAAALLEEEGWAPTGSRCRVTTPTKLCISVTALLIITVGLICSVYRVYLYYQLFSANEGTRVHGWFGVPYDREELLGHSSKLTSNPARYGGLGLYKDTEGLFKEEFELDLEGNSYEEIHVPDFGLRRRCRFIHDFVVNKTGIIDLTANRCYVRPLDRSHVLSPRSVHVLIRKIWNGYYNSVNTQVVWETMHVVGPPVENYQPLGTHIATRCSSYPTFNLKRLYDYVHDMKKRSVGEGEAEDAIEFVEFAGNKIIHLTILGQEEAERQ